MSEPSLKQRTIGALLWNLLDRMGQQVLLFIVGVLVANILSVEDYALVGMLAIFSAIANIVLDSGFSAALIRKQDAEPAVQYDIGQRVQRRFNPQAGRYRNRL